MSSSETFFENGKNAMPLKLANLGYDVWLGNNRGNIYSRGHTNWRAEGPYFDFSFNEMGKYDVYA